MKHIVLVPPRLQKAMLVLNFAPYVTDIEMVSASDG
jgi:hypothetical protein